MMDTHTAAAAVHGRPLGPPVAFARVVTDTRSLARGDLFVALKGERFDGHDFVEQALAAGAAGALVDDAHAHAWRAPLIAVPDTLRALGELAAHWRRRYTLPVVAIVGSNGKTTTKEMVASIFRAAAGPDAVAATAGNLNNAIGVPLMVLGLRAGHRLAVFELGMNHRGETRELAAIVAPTIALVTNAQREHQEFMRSVADVAQEHADAIAALPRDGIAVVNADDAHAALWRQAAHAAGARVVSFALAQAADVTADVVAHAAHTGLVLHTPSGDVVVTLQVPGRHMAANALAAAAAALAAGVAPEAIVRGLAAFRPAAGRLVPRTGARGGVVIDDTYNANPDSVRAAIDVQPALPGTARWLAQGDMGEVGDQGPAFHREIGAYARERGIARLYAAGELMREACGAFGEGARHFASVEALGAALAHDLRADVAVLVKGSRFMRMERVVQAIGAAQESAAGDATGGQAGAAGAGTAGAPGGSDAGGRSRPAQRGVH
jgi:UDP-N-acetylmuramoyl-tripeptide--D-alanyl-D-alanine ligase